MSLYAVALGVGGYAGSGTPWLQWAYEELKNALASDMLKALVTSWPAAVLGSALVFRRPIAAKIESLLRLGYKDVGAEFKQQEDVRNVPRLLPETQAAELAADVVEDAPARAVVTAAGRAGAVAAAAPAGVSIVPSDSEDAEMQADMRAADAQLAAPVDLYSQEHEDRLTQILQQRRLPDEYKIRLLTRWTIGWYVAAECEYVYGAIWGGQVTLLRDMVGGPIEYAQAVRFFEDWKKRNSFTPPDSIDRWISYYEAMTLAVRSGNSLEITSKGRAFLRFLERNSRSDPSSLR
jgi:hypothetical protein